MLGSYAPLSPHDTSIVLKTNTMKILSYTCTIMYLEERMKGHIDKLWDFRTKIAVVISSETLKSIIFCNGLTIYIHVHVNIVKS